MNFPTSVDQILGGYVLQMFVKIDWQGYDSNRRGKSKCKCGSSSVKHGSLGIASGPRTCMPRAKPPLMPKDCHARLQWFPKMILFLCVWRSSCIQPWHTGSASNIRVWDGVLRFSFPFKQRYVCLELCWTRFSSISATGRLCSSRIMPTHAMPVLLNGLCKMFDNYTGQYYRKTCFPLYMCMSISFSVLRQQGYEAWSNISQDGIRYPHDLL